MKAVSELSGDIFVAQEEANARVALHNQLGQVLLMGRHFLEHPDTTDANMVYLVTQKMNAFLLGESEESASGAEFSADKLADAPADAVRLAAAKAESIGVSVEIRGSIPSGENLRALLSDAIQECAANTVKHAEGDHLTVEIAEKDGRTRIEITNNGRPPKGEIAESGGLLALRRTVEEIGGEMTVQASPVFVLSAVI